MYPTREEVEKASRITLARWVRFLHSPGDRDIGRKEIFEQVLTEEKIILDRILERFEEMGGMEPRISKLIGWGDRF